MWSRLGSTDRARMPIAKGWRSVWMEDMSPIEVQHYQYRTPEHTTEFSYVARGREIHNDVMFLFRMCGITA